MKNKTFGIGIAVVAVVGVGLGVWAFTGNRGMEPQMRERVVEVEDGLASEEAFRAQYGQGWRFERGPGNRITRITGGRVTLQDTSPEGVRSFLVRLMPMFHMPPESLASEAEHTGKPGEIQRMFFPQVRDGYRVMNGGLTVYLNMQEELVNIEGQIIPLEGQFASQQLPRDKALEKARETLKMQSLLSRQSEAVVYPVSGGRPELAWVGEGKGEGDKTLRVIVSASSGKVLETAPVLAK